MMECDYCNRSLNSGDYWIIDIADYKFCSESCAEEALTAMQDASGYYGGKVEHIR